MADAEKTTGSRLLASLVGPAPAAFTPATFKLRLVQHLVAYVAIAVFAGYVCAFVFAPLEMLAVSEAVLALVVCGVLFFSPSRQRVRRLVEGGIAASYIVAAGILLKAFDALFRT